ncbi:CDP-diacylglycerol--glycerol-3-phosphate 3-phosphatidyltransferase [Bacillus fonticola]|uniref:CDP-diacylglycerol--glycerol-3-phosphate 3-phosphatidyltransferase n=1 Tax=Bacillus fonticola TaxID=2728853 RepID=UPI00147623D5|nr:CDP-diacylglycerol--glycerol-3-phosphate 3-phosphatidyltransferase [Bacillus fonticola]
MNLPNKITVSRILLIPIFVLLMVIDWDWGALEVGDVTLPWHHFLGALLFIFASTTDWIDGYIARKQNLVTDLGKFLDPLADKLLVSAALIVLVDIGFAPSWVVITIISREFAVTGLRLILAGKGEVNAAGQLGKIKTTTQIIAIASLLLYNIPFESFGIPFGTIFLYISLFFTLWSGWDYFYANRSVFSNSK